MVEGFLSQLFHWIATHPYLGIKGLVVCSLSFGEILFHRLKYRAKVILQNGGLFALWSLVTAVLSVLLLYSLQGVPWVRYGLLRVVEWPSPVKFVVAFVILDFANYTVHRLEHGIPLVWKFHTVHHNDKYMDFSTAIRKHPMAAVFTALVIIPIVLVLGIQPMHLLCYNLIADLVGVVAHTGIPFPPALSEFLRALYIIAPADHKFHHSDYQPETDTNFGQVFSIWDRIFGTYRSVGARDTFRFGLNESSRDSVIDPYARV